jgi:formylglycine-generating enzyme required for sulfatase activity
VGYGYCSILSAPFAPIISAPSSVTAGEAGITANAQAQVGTGFCTYTWSISGGAITAGGSSSQITFTAGPTGVVILGCVATNAAGTASTQGTASCTIVAAPTITSFSAVPTTITIGATSSLTGIFANGTGAITPGNLAATSGSAVTVTPAATKTYTLTVTNSVGTTVTQTATVTAVSPPTMPFITAQANVTIGQTYPASVAAQIGCTYAWTITGGTISGSATGTGINFTAGAARFVQLWCVVTNAAGTSSDQGTTSSTIVSAPATPVIDAPGTVTAGQVGVTASVPSQTGCTYSWTITGGTITAGGTSNQITFTAGTTGTIQLGSVVTNAAGTVSSPGSAMCSIVATPIINSFSASPSTINSGSSAILSWSVTGATSLTIDQSVGAVTGTSTSVVPTTTTTYTLTATNSAGSVTSTTTVAVNKPYIASFTANPTTINPGQSSTLSWSVTGATSLSIDQGVGVVTGTSTTVSPTATTTYTLTATNGAGTDSALVAVTLKDPNSFTLPGGITLEMVPIPAGTFNMGSVNTLDNSDAQPVHSVTISRSFLMGKYKITQQQYNAIMGSNPSHNVGDTFPVEQVHWTDINQAGGFLDMLNTMTSRDRPSGLVFRLPTEAEWEYACRAGSTTEFYFGNDQSMAGNYAWYSSNSSGHTHAVGQKLPNALGLYDMVGDVFEWCHDWYGPYTSSSQTDPVGPTSSSNQTRVVRSSPYFTDYYMGVDACRSAVRTSNGITIFTEKLNANGVGFRVVLGVPLTP